MAVPALPTQKDPLYSWVYDNVHATYGEHWATLYDSSADGSISLAIALTYRAVQLLLEAQSDEEDEDDGPSQAPPGSPGPWAF
jgi:hypothetical protein